MCSFSFKISPEVKNLGVKGLMFRIQDITNTKADLDFDIFLQNELKKYKKRFESENYKADLILQGFRKLHEKVKRSNRKFPASPEELARIFTETGRFPRINLLVDIYNLVSLKTQLALGAHDVSNIKGDITLKLTTGNEKFYPLGSNLLVPVPQGEYSYVDDGDNIICRMEVLQVEPTKITTDTTDVFLIVQGNENTENNYIESAAKEVLDLIIKYCGGRTTSLNSL